MDPQQRLILEIVYEALEDAGITLPEISGTRTSVYAGSFTNDYSLMNAKDMDFYPKYAVNGTSNAILANRVSFFFNLFGPSIMIDTACSASLVGFHLGCQSILADESDYAIIVGSALNFIPNTWQIMTDLGLLSVDGRCRAFDAKGTGYVRGEGVCAVVLKKSSLAIRDSNRIRAMVRATGSNHDGTKSAIGLPSALSQEKLIRATYLKAGLHPDNTQFFEAHGTGTAAGDPREAKAIGSVFGTPSRTEPLYIGSVKTNIGHLEGAAGLIGVIKATLAIEQSKIPPNMLFETPNPNILFDEWKLKVLTDAQDWDTKGPGPRRASINSFGYGGANAHVIIEAANTIPSLPVSNGHVTKTQLSSIKERPFVFLITAHSADSYILACSSLVDYVLQKKDLRLEDLSYSLIRKRTLHKVRSFVVASSRESLVAQLALTIPPVTIGARPAKRIGFVFTGQGAQVALMGQELIQTSPFFRATIERADAVLQGLSPDIRPSWLIIDELNMPKENSRLNKSEFSQPICTALQLALVELLGLWNIKPAAVCGHSSGEIAAAYAAGLLSFEAAIIVAYARGYSMGTAKTSLPGAMMAAGIGEAAARTELKPYEGRLVIAAVNSPSNVTISGDESAIIELLDILTSKQIFARRLMVEQAFHSHHMLPLAPAYLEALQVPGLFDQSQPGCDMLSSVTQKMINPSDMKSEYWVQNMTSPVYFAGALKQVMCDEAAVIDDDNKIEARVDILLEIGPHPALKGPSRQVMSALGLNIPYFGTLNRGTSAYRGVLEAAGNLIAAGYPVDLIAANQDFSLEDCTVTSHSDAKKLYDLPSYSWNHKSFWSTTRPIEQYLHRPARHTILGSLVPTSISSCPRWRNYLRLSEVPWLKEHVFDGKALFPGAGYVSMAIEAIIRHKAPLIPREIKAIEIRDINIKAPLTLSDSEMGSEVYLELCPARLSSKTFSDEWFDFLIASYNESERFTINCTGTVSIKLGKPGALEETTQHPSVAELQVASTRRVNPKTMYRQIEDAGLYLGERFRLIDGEIYCGSEYVVAPVTFDPELYSEFERSEGTMLYPTLLDTCFQSMFYGIESALDTRLDSVFVPTFIKYMKVSGLFDQKEVQTKKNKYVISNHVKALNSRIATGEIQVRNTEKNQLIFEIRGLEMTALATASNHSKDRPLFFQQIWKPCFDFLNQSNIDRTKSLQDILHLYQFQYPCSRILVYVSPSDACMVIITQLLQASNGRKTFSSLDIWGDRLHARVKELSNTASNIQIREPDGKYDLIIVLSQHDIDSASLMEAITLDTVVITHTDIQRFPALKPAFMILNYSVYNFKHEYVPVHEELAIIITSEITAREKQLIDCVRSQGIHTALFSLGDLSESDIIQKNVLVIPSTETKTIAAQADISDKDMQPKMWTNLRNILCSKNRNIVCLLEEATMASKNPEHAKIIGLCRVARNENSDSRILTIDVESNTALDIATTHILHAFNSNLAEDELSYSNNHIYIPRLLEDSSLNAKIPNGKANNPKLGFFHEVGSVSLKIGKIGLLETLHFSQDEAVVCTPLASDEVEIRVKASALNFRDIAAAMGIVSDSKLGDECAGIIHRIGSSVDPSEFAPGDRVVAVRPGQGAHGTFVRQPAMLCVKLPDSFSFTLGASFGGVLTTAYYSLLDIARLQSGETVLIHSATGGVGQMAIQIARMVGARILVTCGSDAKREMLHRVYGIAFEDMFSSRDESFVNGVLDATGGRGVDVILNSLAGSLLLATWSCIAPFGRFVEIGKRDIHQNSQLPMEQFRKNVVFAAVDLVLIYETNQKLAQRILHKCADLFFSGEIQPPEGIVEFPYSEIEAAFRLMQQGKHTGKVVLIPSDHDQVLVSPQTFRVKSTNIFDSEKSYLLIGGLGGLGTVLTEWMCRNGARHIVFFSRSGVNTKAAKETISWLKAKGVKVDVFKGDVTTRAQVELCIKSIGSSFGGLFHAAMVLEDSLLSTMTVDQWNKCIATKCIGAWNLHRATYDLKLDFFVCFSSSSAIIGNKGQANYAAANMYLDALMKMRRGEGKVGSTMNIGPVSDSGVVNENDDVRKSVMRMKHDIINQQEFLLQVEETIKKSLIFSRELEMIQANSSSAETGLPKSFYKIIDDYQTITGINVEEDDLFWANRSLFRNLYANREYSGGSKKVGSLIAILESASTIETKTEILQSAFLDKVARVLGVSIESMSPKSPLAAYGLDSIVALEFVKWFKDAAGLEVALFEIVDDKSIQSLIRKAISGNNDS
jgi:acyl transferase domain-containing protein/NADPH:quinone reductase-like Zn-dependent oxidoreductase/aryl carrier-like protein